MALDLPGRVSRSTVKGERRLCKPGDVERLARQTHQTPSGQSRFVRAQGVASGVEFNTPFAPGQWQYFGITFNVSRDNGVRSPNGLNPKLGGIGLAKQSRPVFR